jgi:hypothetical protein
MATTTKETAASHSYTEMASPNLNPLPLMPINCSAEILEAIKLAPMAHQVNCT